MAKKNDIEMCSTHNTGKSIVTESFIRTLKNKMYKYMTPISKSMYIDKLNDIAIKYNNIYYSTIKMNPVDVRSGTYIDFDEKNNKEDPKFKVGDHVRISKYKSISTKGYVLNWSVEVFVMRKVRNTVP